MVIWYDFDETNKEIKMSVFRCYTCENYFDSDYSECETHPDQNFELICLGCDEDLQIEKEKINSEIF